MRNKILYPINHLLENSTPIPSKKWQCVDIPEGNYLISVDNIFLKDISLEEILSAKVDLPWAEDHFLERINGQPINPGEQYKNWPYYKALDNDALFRSSGKFSHNYMERYWCKGFKGIRFNYGDLNDVIKRLNLDNYTRQAYLSVWHPEDQFNHGERVPCTIGYWFYFQNNQLNLTYHIRSCDAVRHYFNDLYMTFRLLQYVSNEIKKECGIMNIWIGNFHCFVSDQYELKKRLKCAE